MGDIIDRTAAVPRFFDAVRLVIVDGNHLHADIAELANDRVERQAWALGQIEMYLTVRKDCTAMTTLEIAKRRTLLNNVASSMKGCTKFMDILEACMVY